ncbi:putative mitochondrial-processing peptidase subunit beta, mitochondrial [Wolffia australiana]
MNRERDVILREMEEVEGQAEEVIIDHLHATAFQYTPLGRTILGSAQNFKTITQQHLVDYIATHYTAPRIVISAVGAAKHQDIVAQVEKLFTKHSDNPTIAWDFLTTIALSGFSECLKMGFFIDHDCS